MSNSIDSLIARFFEEQLRSRPSMEITDEGRRPRTFGEQVRIEVFATTHQPQKKQGVPWDNFKSKVYKLEHSHVSVVIAVYDDGRILWLDDHIDDSDFAEFVRREQLLEWLPDQFNRLLELLIETKLNYLGASQVIHSTSDVPAIRDDVRNRYASLERWNGTREQWEAGRSSLLEADKRLTDVADQIQSPIFTLSGNGKAQVSFYVWTKILGKIVKIDCFFGPGHAFRLESVQLAQGIGRFMVPR
jgi:hypothetical protein